MPKIPLNIFLPAAGLGERLRPVTNHIPKPLLPLLGRPLIGIILGKLTSICEGKIGVNLHHKPEMIREWFRGSPYADQVTFFPEDRLLGTGGALKNAEPFLAGSHFIVHNADILLDISFNKLVEAHFASGNIATLATHRHPDLSNVVIDDNDCVIDVENPGASRPDPARIARKVAYTGVAVYSPDILRFLPAGVSHATAAWIAASKAGYKVKTMDFTGSYWSDIGTPASYTAAVLDTLKMIGESVYCSSAARVGEIDVDGYAVIEKGGSVRGGSRLRNCIVMPGAEVTGSHENCIIGPGYDIPLTELEMQPSIHAAMRKDIGLAGPFFAHFDPQASGKQGSIAQAMLIGLGGSDRRYFRLRNGALTAVLMESGSDDPDYERHLSYTTFFHSHGVPVPRLLGVDARGKRALFEDLGDLSLFSYLRFPHDADVVEALYRRVLDILATLHGRASEHVDDCPLLASRIFDYDHLRWETSYFLERFVIGLRKAGIGDRKAVEEEFHLLAKTVSSFPPAVIHRDFQSQNIMLQAGVPRVIDYQGARMAPPAYDVASILWDPYHRIDETMRERLLSYYIQKMQKETNEFDGTAFRGSLLSCRLQRHMQALGAYGFLSVVKGKKYFLKHVPEALRLLKQETSLSQSHYPELHRLVTGLA
jgi:NDP-sugar pyrophosphorylase family protein/aminoglycoside/choline kinase family phosphotransferase